MRGQAVRNNAYGTWVLARAAIAAKVEKFVLVSTDKAVNPTNVMGATKRLAEIVCQSLQGGGTQFVLVRFGNVFGSAGSVIPRFSEQIARGSPVTVTHPDITRFFMSLSEATQLLLQAGLQGKGGEILVLDMGEPVRIVDLAHDMIRLSGVDPERVPIVFTGLRPGEKLYEEPLASEEATLPTPHPKLRIAQARAANRDAVGQMVAWCERDRAADDAEVRARLKAWIPEYAPSAGAPVQPIPSGGPCTARRAWPCRCARRASLISRSTRIARTCAAATPGDGSRVIRAANFIRCGSGRRRRLCRVARDGRGRSRTGRRAGAQDRRAASPAGGAVAGRRVSALRVVEGALGCRVRAAISSRRRFRLHGGGEKVAIQKHELQRDRGRRQRQHGAACVGAQSTARRRIEQGAHLRCEPRDIARRTNESGVVTEHEFRRARLGARHHGKFAGHRLQRGFGRGIVERRQHERVRGAVPASRIHVEIGYGHAIGDAEGIARDRDSAAHELRARRS